MNIAIPIVGRTTVSIRRNGKRIREGVEGDGYFIVNGANVSYAYEREGEGGGNSELVIGMNDGIELEVHGCDTSTENRFGRPKNLILASIWECLDEPVHVDE